MSTKRTKTYPAQVQLKMLVPGRIAERIDKMARQELRPSRSNMALVLIERGLAAQKEVA